MTISRPLPQTDALAFIIAGNSTVTFKNRETGKHFTYRVQQAPAKNEGDARPDMWFVKVLTGADNEGDYQYLGFIRGSEYVHGKKSRIAQDAQSNKVFEYVFRRLCASTLPDVVEVWHEGRCGRCNRLLTDPLSISLGIGPTCRGQG